jgi:hypothetical protein
VATALGTGTVLIMVPGAVVWRGQSD